jgi:hypothetical protein
MSNTVKIFVIVVDSENNELGRTELSSDVSACSSDGIQETLSKFTSDVVDIIDDYNY